MTRSRTPASDASDWINPVAVKEFRQAVQSRWVVAVLMLFLLLNLTVVGGYLLLSPDIDSDSEGGQKVFFFLLSILVFVCLGFVPVYTGSRLLLERHSTDIDLFFTTALTPGAIVRGKYLAAMALTILFTITMVGAYTWGEMMAGFGGWGAMVDLIPGSFIWFGFILCYCLTIAALRPVLFRNVPTLRLSVFVISFGVAMCLVPCLMAFFIEQYWWLADPWYFALSPLALTARSDVIRNLADSIVVAWLGLAALAAAPWGLGQWHRFTPHCPPPAEASS